MALYLIDSIYFPVFTSTVFVLVVYALVIIKKIIGASGEKNNAQPNVERLKQSLPITVSTSWKLREPVNGVTIWENQTCSSETDNGMVACQAIIQSPAEVVIRELSQPRLLQLIHPLIHDVGIAPGSFRNKQPKDPEISSDTVSIEMKAQSIFSLVDLYFRFKNCFCLRRKWKSSKDSLSWFVIAPETKLHENLFGTWQCFMAVDIPNETNGSNSSMCLLCIFAAPQSINTMPLLKHIISSQVICLREHIDSLYLKKIFRKEMSVSKDHSTIHTTAKVNGTTTRTTGPKDGMVAQVQSPAKRFTGKEERGFVELPAEINRTPKDQISNDEQSPNESNEIVDDKINIYKDVISEALKMLIEIYEADENTPGWNYLGNRNGVEVYRMPGDASCLSDCFKGTSQAKVPISYALQYCMNLEYKKEWDDVFNEGTVVEDLDEVTKITYMEYKPVWPTTARDFCSVVATRHIKGSIYAMAAKAITHPSCPPRKGRQRAEIIAGGFIIEGITEDPPLCKVTYVTRADLKGRIPAGLVNKVNEKQPMYAGVVRDKLEERFMYQDPPAEGDVKIIAARRYPSVIEKPSSIVKTNVGTPDAKSKVESQGQLKSFDSEVGNATEGKEKAETLASAGASGNVGEIRELSGEEIDELVPENDTQWDSTSQTSSFDPSEENDWLGDSQSISEQSIDLPRDAFGNVDHKTLGNQTAAKLLEEILLASEVDSKSKSHESHDALEQWTYQGTMKNVVVLRKIHSNSNFYSFLGRGIIEVLPLTVWEAVKNPSTRFVYDNMLKKTKVVKEIDDGLKVIHMKHETTACFVKQARDFVILTKERMDTRKYIIAGVSVDVPECPRDKTCIRGKVLASGWTIEPVLIKGKLCSLVTYLSQVDFGGRLPVRLINLIAKRQPMSISYLRTYLESAEMRS